MHPIKQLLIERNGCKCMLCGQEVEYEQLNWHHIIPKSWCKRNNLPIDNSYDNAALVCANCHAYIHRFDYGDKAYEELTKKMRKNKK